MLRCASVRVGLGLLLLVTGCAAEAPRSAEQTSLLPRWPDPRTTGGVAEVIGFATAQVGKRYCWGGTGPACFDCSGLVQAAWKSAGVALPRTSDAQGRALVDVPVLDVLPGDILWWHGHVGLYVGGGEMIDAYHSGAGVVRRRAVKPERVLRVVVPSASATGYRFAADAASPHS